MIIQLRSRKPFTLDHNHNHNHNYHHNNNQNPFQKFNTNPNMHGKSTEINKSNSPSITMHDGNLIRNKQRRRKHSPNFNTNTNIKNSVTHRNRNVNAKYGHSHTFYSANNQGGWQNSDNSYFKPILQPRRTYGSLKYFLEVVQKKVRARSIQDTFQHCNYELDMGESKKRGFRGSKLSPYSQFYGAPQSKQYQQGQITINNNKFRNKTINWRRELNQTKLLDQPKQLNQTIAEVVGIMKNSAQRNSDLRLHSQSPKKCQLKIKKQQQITVQTQPTSQSVLSNFQAYLNQYQQGYHINSNPKHKAIKPNMKTTSQVTTISNNNHTAPSSNSNSQTLSMLTKEMKRVSPQTHQLGLCRNKFRYLKQQAVP